MYACGAARIDHACDLSHMHVVVLIDRVVSFASAAYVRTSLSWSDRLYACVRQQRCFFRSIEPGRPTTLDPLLAPPLIVRELFRMLLAAEVEMHLEKYRHVSHQGITTKHVWKVHSGYC